MIGFHYMMCCMRLGYGINRTPAELRKAGADRVWIDTNHSDRMERADLFTNGLRAGCVLVLLSRSDLGRGKEIERFEGLAAKIGVSIEIVEPPKSPGKLRPGPVPKFNPDDQQRARIEHYWHGPFKRSEAKRQASEIMGYEVTDNMLNRALGPRSKPSKEQS